VGGLVCVLSSFLISLELRCASSSDCGGCWNMSVLGPCMVTYIATLIGLAQINRSSFSST
jgi:hypothetical protein